MIAFARELLCEVVQEVQPLLIEHHKELGPAYPLTPDWDQYTLLERLGRLCIFTGREDGRLVAYAAFHLIPHLHSRGFVQAFNDCLYVEPKARHGTPIMRFLKFCDSQLMADGAQQAVYMANRDNNLGALLNIIGYGSEQTMLTKTFEG